MPPRFPRLRSFLDENFSIIVAMLVVVLFIGGSITYTTHISPGTTTIQQPTESWETTGQFTHSATVSTTNPVFPVDTTLRDRSVYFTTISPQLDGTYAFAYNASESGNLSRVVSLSLILRGVEQQQGQGKTVLWQTSRRLNRVSAGAAPPGERVRVPFSIDMNEVIDLRDRIRNQFAGTPGRTEVFVRASVDLQGTVNGKVIDRSKEYTLPVELRSSTYEVGSADPATEQYDTLQTMTVEKTYSSVRSTGAPIVFSASVVTLIGLVVARQQDQLELSQSERRQLRYEDEREDFDEWISIIQLPEEVFDRPRAEATSLGALVDFAIDTDNCVIEDPNGNSYYVVHDDYLYTYQSPEGADNVQTDIEQNTPMGIRERVSSALPVSNTAEGSSEPTDGTQSNE